MYEKAKKKQIVAISFKQYVKVKKKVLQADCRIYKANKQTKTFLIK